jgi:hypothetical protein
MKNAAALIAGIGMCAAAALSLCGPGLRSPAHATPAPDRAVWVETKWPFSMDEWGEGKAYRCSAADCGVQINLYIRVKAGFCSSTRGIADDDELDRLSDFDFMEGSAAPLAGGHAVDVGRMKGRIRAYAVSRLIRPQTYSLSVAFNSHDDAVVATVVMDGGQPAAIEPVVIGFLSGRIVQQWVSIALGL